MSDATGLSGHELNKQTIAKLWQDYGDVKAERDALAERLKAMEEDANAGWESHGKLLAGNAYLIQQNTILKAALEVAAQRLRQLDQMDTRAYAAVKDALTKPPATTRGGYAANEQD